MTTEYDAEQRAADVRAVADHLAARPDEISRLVLEAHEAGRGDLGNVLASLAAVFEDRSNLLRQLDEARSELDLVTAERDALRKDIDDAIARQAATVAKRAKEISDRAAYIAQFAAEPQQQPPT